MNTTNKTKEYNAYFITMSIVYVTIDKIKEFR